MHASEYSAALIPVTPCSCSSIPPLLSFLQVGDPLDLRLFEATGWELVGEQGTPADVGGTSQGHSPDRHHPQGLEEVLQGSPDTSTNMLTFVRPGRDKQVCASCREGCTQWTIVTVSGRSASCGQCRAEKLQWTPQPSIFHLTF